MNETLLSTSFPNLTEGHHNNNNGTDGYNNGDDEGALYEVPVSIVVLLSLLYGAISVAALIGNILVLWVVSVRLPVKCLKVEKSFSKILVCGVPGPKTSWWSGYLISRFLFQLSFYLLNLLETLVIMRCYNLENLHMQKLCLSLFLRL